MGNIINKLNIIDIYDAINKEADSILKYLYTRKDTDLTQYYKDRETALNKLSNLCYNDTYKSTFLQ